MNGRKRLVVGGAAALGCLVTRTGWAANCFDLPNPIYLSGSSAFGPTAGAMAVQLAKLTPPVTLVYSATASCDGPTNILGDKPLTGTASIYLENAMTATDPTKFDTSSCTLDGAATPVKADVGISDIFWENCPGIDPRPASIPEVGGPVQAMIFIVPELDTTFSAMSAEQAQDIWGCGMKGAIGTFTDDLAIQQRNAGSGTQGVVAKAINVAPAAFKGTTNASGGNLVTSLTGVLDPQKAIGFLAADSYDTKRGTLNAVAFRAFGQTKAFYADSAADTFDKRNVRDGHYVVWGPEHFYVKTGNDNGAKFIGWVNGTLATTAFNYIDVEARAGVVPQCAMKVTRTNDGGYLGPYTPADPCGCYFESVVNKNPTPTGCTVCTDDTACTGTKKCHHNFCE